MKTPFHARAGRAGLAGAACRTAAALTFTLLFAARAHASPATDAARVIARYVEATGGAAAFAAESTEYSHAMVSAFGFTGEVRTWSARPARHLVRTKLGPFALSEGYDGAVSWRTDPTTGRVVRLTDRDELESRVGAWFEFERWAEPGLGGGHAEVASHEKDSTGTYTVLAVQSPGAGDLKPRKLWFSDATGLLAREEAPHDQTWIVTNISDWRTLAGRKRSFTTETVIANMPANRMSATIDTLLTNVPSADVPFSPPDSTGGNALRWLAAPGEATLPFRYIGRHVWLRASIDGGPPQDFLFDTGASVTVLDSAFAAQHGIKAEGHMEAAGAGAAGSAAFGIVHSLAIRDSSGDGVELRDLHVGVLSVNPMFSGYFWRDMAGIIGYDVISRFVVTIDYDRHLLVLHDPKTYRYDGREAPLALVMNGVVPGVHATLDGRDEGVFRLDVGSSSTVDVHTPFAKAHELAKRLRHAMPISGAGFGGQFVSNLGRLRSMAIGPYHWDDPMVSLANATEGAFASEDFAGNIGNRVLERFRVTLDYQGHRLWLEPGRRYAARDAFTHAGVLLVQRDGHIEAMSILPGSPAARAGLREGDTIVTVDGRPVRDVGLEALDEAFEQGPNGRRMTFEIAHDGKPKTVTVTLREMLD